MSSDQYFTGQCIGGPDDGNLISASVKDVHFSVTYRRQLDGPDMRKISEETIYGVYRWQDSGFTKGTFQWESKHRPSFVETYGLSAERMREVIQDADGGSKQAEGR
jgi:hypothetical protein